jgi:hypothetical protein
MAIGAYHAAMDAALRRISLWIAALAGVIALASIASPPLRTVLFPATIVTAGSALLLFLRMLGSRAFRRASSAMESEMKADERARGAIRLRDRDWGLFGSRAGTPALLRVRAVLFVGLLPLMLAHEWTGDAVVVLWFCGAFVAIELSILHAAQPLARSR